MDSSFSLGENSRSHQQKKKQEIDFVHIYLFKRLKIIDYQRTLVIQENPGRQ
jgi:hypothetical protein